jgi:3-oxoacyl-[acyl-carrier-protein] synthase II
MPACHISIICDLQGPNNSITAGEASSVLAMGESLRSIARNTADVFLTGGTDMRIHPLSVVRFALLNRLTIRNDLEPSQAVRPFDHKRSGIVAGEGAGILLFEALEHARKRNAKIVAEVLGFGSSCHSQDSAYAVAAAIEQALADAEVKPSEVSFVSANATGAAADYAEAIGIHRVFGQSAPQVPVVAFKSYYGHAFAASGSIDLIACLIAQEQGRLPATLNFEAGDDGFPPLNILQEPIDFPKGPFVIYNMSFSGQCGALVVKPYRD